MKIDKEILEEQLNVLINTYGENRCVKAKIYEYYAKKKYNEGTVADILALRIHLGILNIIDLGLFTTAMYNALKSEKHNVKSDKIEIDISLINPNRFFNDIELKYIRDYEEEDVTTPLYPIIFKDVSILDHDQFTLSIPVQQIVDLCNKKLLIYNSKTQRALKVKKLNDYIIQSIDINQESVREMIEEMLSGLFIPNYITLNILDVIGDDGNNIADFQYNPKTRELIIRKGDINILDGMHRLQALIVALNKDEELEMNMGLKITNFDIPKANRYIVQENKRNAMNDDHIKEIDVGNMSNNVTKKLNESTEFHLSGELTINNAFIGRGKKIKLPIIADAIRHTFNPKNKKDYISNCGIIIDRLNYIIESESYLFDVPAKNQLIWAYYICLAYKTKDTSNWKEFIDYNIPFNIDTLAIKSISKKTISKILNIIVSKERDVS